MLPACRWSVLLLLTAAAPLAAQQPSAPTRGDRQFEDYFRIQTKKISDACLADVKDRADWEKKRPELRRQFLEMMGLWPLPPKTDLRPVITGKVEADAFTVEKLHFQSSPGLYVTGNLYVPKKATFPAPAVLYVCGHAKTAIDGVSYGHHVNYQHHPAWFATHGYVCLIIDTLQLGEIEGVHHGTYNRGMWWWQTLGYTPAGIECWNAMRALDYLETRKEVDPRRIGVTGRSGGGATSWWLAAADDRPQCIVPVAGIADLHAHLVEGPTPRVRSGVIAGHCDCMYHVNLYRWDFPLVAALCAPRPLMLGNSVQDDIFPVPGYQRLAEKVRKIYDLYGAAHRFVVLETAGPHKDTPELRLGAYRWMNRWLMKHDPGEAHECDPPRFTPQQLKVFNRLPEDATNTYIHEVFIKPARVELPNAPEVARAWWKEQPEQWLQFLKEKVFHGWAADPPPLNVRPAKEIVHKGLRLRAYDFTSEEGMGLRLWVLTAEKVERPAQLAVNVLDEKGWNEWRRELGPAFKDLLQDASDIGHDEAAFERQRRLLEVSKWAMVTVAPRGVGPTRFSGAGTLVENHIRRRFVLLGQTLDGQRVWDVRRGLAVLRSLPDLKGAPIRLSGNGEAAGIALYAAVFEPDVSRLDLWHLPRSHRQGPTFLNVRKAFDLPQAVALAFPRKIYLHLRESKEEQAWQWPLALQKALGQEYLKVRVGAASSEAAFRRWTNHAVISVDRPSLAMENDS